MGLWEGQRDGMMVELELTGRYRGGVQPVSGRFNLRLLLRQCRYQGFGLEKMLDPDPYTDPH